MPRERLIIISGVSGSGKSTALDALEDQGFFCVDNLPAPLITSFVDFLIDLQQQMKGALGGAVKIVGQIAPPKDFALLIDCRDQHSFAIVKQAMDRLAQAGADVSLLFFDCSDEIIIRRFQETRRPHPLLRGGSSASTIAEAVARERELLTEFRAAAARIVDTSSYTPHDLRRTVEEYVGAGGSLELKLLSFGFKFGVPYDADLVVDVRFLPNPHFVPELRESSGLEPKVEQYVFSSPVSEELLSRYVELLKFLLPHYQKEGKRYLTVAIGCTGGKHRSVAVARRLQKGLEGLGVKISTRDRDLNRL